MTDTIGNLLDTVICGDVLDKLPGIPTGSVHCVVTSPPYWGLRDYGVDGQLGLEKTPEEYIAKIVAVFREVWRVLRDDGTLWLNMGDSYNAGRNGGHAGGKQGSGFQQVDERYQQRSGANAPGLKPKDLCGIPWRLALALQADGWYLRQDIIEEVELYCPCGCGYILEERIWRYSQDREIIWKKPNPMPESVTDRCTKAHEYIFLMTKKAHYYYDAEIIKEDAKDAESYSGRTFRGPKAILEAGARPGSPQTIDKGCPSDGKTYPKVNKRSVWTVPTCPYPEAHFATFPPKLIEPCILAGCPEWVCVKCGEPRRRIVESELSFQSGSGKSGNPITGKNGPDLQGGGETGDIRKGPCRSSKTTGWTKCNCNAGFDGGIVLDPFGGAFTTALVAYQNNRHYCIIELSEEYVRLGKARLENERNKYGLLEP